MSQYLDLQHQTNSNLDLSIFTNAFLIKTKQSYINLQEGNNVINSELENVSSKLFTYRYCLSQLWVNKQYNLYLKKLLFSKKKKLLMQQLQRNILTNPAMFWLPIAYKTLINSQKQNIHIKAYNDKDVSPGELSCLFFFFFL